MAQSLKELLERDQELVLTGVQRGGKLYPVRGYPVAANIPDRDVYIEKFNTKFFMTLKPRPQAEELEYRIDEFYPNTGVWMRQKGVAHFVTDNQVQILESDGSHGTVVPRAIAGGYTVYRARSGETSYAQHSSNTVLSTVAERDATVGKVCVTCYGQ